MPEPITDEAQLDELLSRPDDVVRKALADIDGPLLVLGAGGKMGPTLARMARRAGAEVVAVSRFTDPAVAAGLSAHGVRVHRADLLRRDAVWQLPDAGAVIFMAGAKFGTRSAPHRTWACNAWLPGLVAERYEGVPTVVFSSGNVYPLMPRGGPGADEATSPAPTGEYAWSVLARERMFERAAAERATPVLLFRLNYAVELRYGVLVDIADAVRGRRPVDVRMGAVNVLWQGDANRYALAALAQCAAPAAVLNATGAEVLSVRQLASALGDRLGETPVLEGVEEQSALLADARRAIALFGSPSVAIDTLLDWTADWIARGGVTWGKPTHFEVRDGSY